VVIKVFDGVNVLVIVDVDSSRELVSPALEDGVCVEVVVMTVTDSEEVGGRVTTEEVLMTVWEVVSLLVTIIVVEDVVSGSLVGVAVPDPVAESVESPEPPVVKGTL